MMPQETESAPYWSQPLAELLAKLHTTSEGLSPEVGRQRLKEVGPNTLQVGKRFSILSVLLGQFKSPLVLLLVFAALVSAFVQEWVDAAIVIAVVLSSALLGFIQEYRASAAVERLRDQIRIKSTVLRGGTPCQLPAEAVVPGDVVLLAAGSLIPADGILIEGKDFFVNQAVLTGETFPVTKSPEPVAPDAPLAARNNMLFMGTSVRSGTARVLIVQTGSATALGQIAERLTLRPPETEFERGIRHFGYLLTQVMVGLLFLVFAANVFAEKPPIDALLFAIALAVGLAPELLPAIITINLSQGAQQMAAHGVLVRRLNAIENLGSMDLLCTDKTGTLTEGNARLAGALDPAGQPSPSLLRLAYLNAFFQTGLPNPLDEAIIAQAKQEGVDLTASQKVDEIPYDFLRKRLSVVARDGSETHLITKGALEQVLEVCSQIREGESLQPLTPERRAEIEARYAEWGSQGIRVLGLATRCVTPRANYEPSDEQALLFCGFLLFLDPPKAGIQQTLTELKQLGVEIKIITGDNRQVARHLAEQVGLSANQLLTGAELNRLPEDALWHLAERTTVFAEVDPHQKERIIGALRKRGHVVGYMGDGINDASALHAADVGISVEHAVDVAKEAADFVLLRQDLEVLREGILRGRVTFANTIKYIFTTTSANFGNMFSMAGASLFLPFLPLLAKQILLNNFLSDLPGMTIASDNVDPDLIEKPYRWNIGFIRQFMVLFGLVSSLFDFLTFGLLLLVLRVPPDLFRTAWFVESLLTELVIALVVRTRKPFYQSKPGRWLWGSTLAVALFTLLLPYLPFGPLLGFTPLPVALMVVLGVITLLYVIAAEATKRRFFRSHHL